MVKPDSLKEMGGEYQSKVLCLLITDIKFLKQVYDILLIDYFESEARQWIVKLIKKYYSEYKSVLTHSVFKSSLASEKNEILKIDIIDKFKEISLYKNSNDLKFVKDDFVNFCINQHYKLSIYHSIDDLENKNYDAIKNRFKEAARVGLDPNIGLYGLDENIDKVFEELKRNTINTPWETINDITEGGLGPKELGIIVAPPGAGKTWLLCSLGYAALRQGKHVIHYTLELSENMILRRYYSIMTGIPSENLKFNKNDIHHKIKALLHHDAKLIIKEYPPKRASIDTLNSHFDRIKNLYESHNSKYFILVDYGDLLKAPQYYKDKRLEIGNIFEELRGFAVEEEIPIWTGTQVNRSGAKEDYIEGESVSEDYSKIMTGDFLMSMSRKIEDKKNKTARAFIIKNRFGPDKMGFPAKFNVYTGQCEIYNTDSFQGQNIKNEMKNNENLVKDELREKYFKIKEDENKNRN